MPNHTMFPKYSQKKEIRIQSCKGVASALGLGITFVFPLASCGFSAPNVRGCLASFLSTVVRDSKVPYSLSGGSIRQR